MGFFNPNFVNAAMPESEHAGAISGVARVACPTAGTPSVSRGRKLSISSSHARGYNDMLAIVGYGATFIQDFARMHESQSDAIAHAQSCLALSGREQSGGILLSTGRLTAGNSRGK